NASARIKCCNCNKSSEKTGVIVKANARFPPRSPAYCAAFYAFLLQKRGIKKVCANRVIINV
ncbi:hypothetical protein ACU6QH_00290, partial [Aeromonas veronii]|uniref:hypothetical protein n=1 Tax=Aeromonas veronii TaxID=654 RepID=UPI00406D4B69